MAKRGRHQAKADKRNAKRSSHGQCVDPEDMDDEIDAFHKQRDIIPLDVNDDGEEESMDEEEPVLDFEDVNDEDESEDGADDEDGDEYEEDEDEKGLAAKIRRQRKYMREKFGALDEEIDGDEEENDEDEKKVWGGKKGQYYGGDEYEIDSSDDEAIKEEEEEVLRILKKKASTLKPEDYGLEKVDEDESDKELTLEGISSKGKSQKKDSLIQEATDSVDAFEELKKNLSALTREEKMNIVNSSAPELIGLLSELNDALQQLETRVNPLLAKVKMGGVTSEGGIRYLEVQQLLLLAYCQAITFYLLLKSEGQSVCDHPVIARLVEIKGLLDKMKPIEGNLLSQLEEMLKKSHEVWAGENKVTENAATASVSEYVKKGHRSSLATSEADAQEAVEPSGTSGLVKAEFSRVEDNKEKKKKHKADQVSVQSMEMLKVRAALEEKLRRNSVLSSIPLKLDKSRKHPKSVNGRLETHDDFDDDATHVEKGNHGLSNGQTSMLGLSKLSQLVSAKQNKSKVISGDDDLPKRDDIGERRRKHELRVLASAGVKSEDDAEHEPGTPESLEASDMDEDGDEEESEEDDFYKAIKQKKEAKDAAKAKIYTRTPTVPSEPETVDGKRQITRQIEKNRGLTRPRRKDMKNPRKKYRTKHDKQKKSRAGQVRQIRKPAGPYSGEPGINAAISRSIRF